MGHQRMNGFFGRDQIWISGAKGPDFIRSRQDPQPEPGKRRQRPFGTDHEPLPVLAPIAAAPCGSTKSMNASIQQNRFHTQDIIAGDAIAKAMSSTGVHGDVAAERANRPARRIGGIKDAMGLECFIELVQRDAAFHFAPESRRGDLTDASQGRGMDDQSPLGCDRSTGKRRPCPSNADRNLELSGTFQHPHHLIGVGGNHHRIGSKRFVTESIGVVPGQLSRCRQHAAAYAGLFQNSVESIGSHSRCLEEPISFRPKDSQVLVQATTEHQKGALKAADNTSLTFSRVSPIS